MLYFIPTPIGNLKDITYRAIEILKSVDLILCEDTRTSKVLLSHYQIQKPVQAYHQHNEHERTDAIIQMLQTDKNIALITDAGTPGISDPAYLLVKHCVQQSIPFQCLPGATAFVPALVNSGLPINQFLFYGFLPVKKGRQTALNVLAEDTRTLVFYESPHRLVKFLVELKTIFGETRQLSISRELTKIYEETRRGTVAELWQHFSHIEPRGEFVIVVEGKSK